MTRGLPLLSIWMMRRTSDSGTPCAAACLVISASCGPAMAPAVGAVNAHATVASGTHQPNPDFMHVLIAASPPCFKQNTGTVWVLRKPIYQTAAFYSESVVQYGCES